MITPEQIKAARALLNWKQTILAEEAGLSLPSINNVERGMGSPRVDTMVAIQTALENGGIQFISGLGVQLREEIFEVHEYEGEHFMKKLNDDLFSCMKSKQDEVVMCSIDERMFPEHVPDEMLRYYNYHKEVQFKERILLRDSDEFLLSSPETYRWISAELIGTIPYYVYQDRFAMVMWEAKRSVVMRNQSIADSFRRQFDFLWDMAKPISPNLTNQLEDQKFIEAIKDA